MKCSRCGRPLKDPKYVKIGIGSVCLKKELSSKQAELPIPGIKKFRPLFSRRRAIAREAVAYLQGMDADADISPTNIVTALSALGYLKEKEEEI